MSEETLRRFLERLNGDASFRESVQKDAGGAFAEFGLSPAEQVALASNDEDALRRLAGAEVEGYLLNLGNAMINLRRPIDTTPEAGCQGGQTRDWNCGGLRALP